MKDKGNGINTLDKAYIYNGDNMYTIERMINNSVPLLVYRKNNEIVYIIKEIIKNKNTSTLLSYYNCYDYNLEEFLTTDPIYDVKSYRGKDLMYEFVVDEWDIETLDFSSFSNSRISNFIKFLSGDKQFRIEDLKNRTTPFREKLEILKERYSESFKINSLLGDFVFERNPKDFPDGFCVKLNDIPIVIIEYSKELSKFILKRYPNKYTVFNDDYMNLDSFGICESDITKELIESILSDIEEDNND